MNADLVEYSRASYNSIGRWEYDVKNDTIVLQERASQIYFNQYVKKEVKIREFFSVLCAESSTHLSKVLTTKLHCETRFTQKVLCTNGQTKYIMVIIGNNGTSSERNKYGLSIDITNFINAKNINI